MGPRRGVLSAGGRSVSGTSGRKTVLGLTVTMQLLGFLLALLVLTAGIGFAVLRWLEGTS